ncbi:holin, partial [Enterocloster citroniae]
VNEIRSILENLVECGYNVPAFLIKGLAVTEKLINAETEKVN